jgi:molybdopterin-guanine dinucleotide biosynthesis protein A
MSHVADEDNRSSAGHELPALSAVLLSGGRAERFGSEKGLAPFGGRTLAAQIIAVLEQVSDDVWISTNRPELYSGFGKPIVTDIHPGQGPLAGLHAALRVVRHDLLAVAPCDMPFASAALFAYMQKIARDYEVVVPTCPAHGGAARMVYEPLHALYSRRCLRAIEDALTAGERRVQSWFAKVRVREVPIDEWRGVPGVAPRVFMNVNTQAQLQQLMDNTGPDRDE